MFVQAFGNKADFAFRAGLHGSTSPARLVESIQPG
jgi:hypothetical protein